MNGACQASAGGANLYRETYAFIDCMARSLGDTGFVALSRPGSTVSLVTTALFTIAVAMLGYRLLLGGRVSMATLVGLLARIGFVLAATTSWEAYRTLFYDTALTAPRQLVARIAGDVGAPETELADRLQLIDGALVALSRPREPDAAPVDMPRGSPLSPSLSSGPAPSAPGLMAQDVAAGSPVAEHADRARLILMVTALGPLGAVRLLAGLMLAIGPLFIACITLAGSRGLFIGWLRVLGGAALASFGVTMLLWIETVTLQPMIQGLLVAAGRAPLGSSDMVALTGMLLVMAVAVLAVLLGCVKLMSAIRWPDAWAVERLAPGPAMIADPGVPPPPEAMPGRDARPGGLAERSRAAELASSVERQAQRDRGTGPRQIGGSGQAVPALAPQVVRVGGDRVSSARRTGTRISAASGRRDKL